MIVCLIVLFIIALYAWLIAPCRKCPDDSALKGYLYAHRGLHDGNLTVAENSLEAFALAAENGYGMELDVQLTRDGKLVVCHDGHTGRVSPRDVCIQQTDYADLPPLVTGSRIPLFADVLRLVDGRVPLIVEVKHHGGPERNAEATWKLLQDYTGPYCVESFNPLAMRYFRRHAPHIVRGQLVYGGKWNPEDMSYPAYLSLKLLVCNVISRPHFIAHSVPTDRTVGMRLMKKVYKPRLAAWTIRSQEVLDYTRREGYDYPIFEKFKPE